MRRAVCAFGSLILVLAADPLWAGGASAADAGVSGVAASTGNAGADATGRLDRINQYSVKSYTVMRQLITASGMKVDSAASASGR